MTSRLVNRGAFLWTVSLLLVCVSPCAAESIAGTSHASSKLVALAAAQFPNLTHAERAMLEFADVDNIDRGEFAVAGISSNPDDSSNDPAHADKWDAQREIRPRLVRWMCIDPAPVRMVDPRGLRILGARLTGPLDLSYVRVPFPIVLRNCAIGERIDLTAMSAPALDLDGSYTGEIEAPSMNIENDLSIGHGFHAAGEVWIWGSRIGGSLDAWGGHFKHSRIERHAKALGIPRLALAAEDVRVDGDVYFCCGFEADGDTSVARARIGGNMECPGARFSNPNDYALAGADSRIDGVVHFGFPDPGFHTEVDGLVQFVNAKTNGFAATFTRFRGGPDELHGLVASDAVFHSFLMWMGNELDDGTTLDLQRVTADAFYDDRQSWPKPGHLLIDGLTYASLGGGAESLFGPLPPRDAPTRLRWLALQPGFHPQPYRQLAKVLRESGDQAGATQVLIAGDDLNYRRFGLLGRSWGAFLNTTIGYGHRPLRAIVWSLGVVLLGWIVVTIAKGARVMRLTWPETTAPPTGDPLAQLYPLLYSLDVFLPFVNLHQEHYWWPDAEASGDCVVAMQNFRVRGSLVQYYLWLQIIAGWLLSAIFIAGVTGLIRGD